MSFNDHKTFWAEFIELYREQRCLWDVKSKNYSNKHVRRDGYTALVEKCREIFPDCDEKFVKSKIEILRASFRRELKKVQSSNKTGSGQDEVYEPCLWYFDLMLFITDQEVIRKGLSSIGKRPRDTSLDEDEGEVDEEPEILDDIQDNQDDTASWVDHVPSATTSRSSSSLSRPSAPNTPNTPSTSGVTNRTNRKKKSSFDKKQEQFLDVATAVLGNQTKFRAFGNNVAYQLEDMVRPQQVIAEKLISDVLFHGKLGSLKPNASVLTGQLSQSKVQPLNQLGLTRIYQKPNPNLFRSVESECFLQPIEVGSSCYQSPSNKKLTFNEITQQKTQFQPVHQHLTQPIKLATFQQTQKQKNKQLHIIQFPKQSAHQQTTNCPQSNEDSTPANLNQPKDVIQTSKNEQSLSQTDMSCDNSAEQYLYEIGLKDFVILNNDENPK